MTHHNVYTFLVTFKLVPVITYNTTFPPIHLKVIKLKVKIQLITQENAKSSILKAVPMTDIFKVQFYYRLLEFYGY